ncbi:hypothetical protein LOTGIDRAFT_234335 [Lottia gigantea]|uniref:Cilia- and flagella-associated protein HOATZ n=1 Tax=Lottia gigantea TaxID=225164 RepID=V4A8B3_LOTGI|nr:hypothetical protein LOTGIDRAFT_234335 [Lottia gigantea]ESO89526.1 hypothetical protein LOTGIDRAFT_234335 [Lottia gigantea]
MAVTLLDFTKRPERSEFSDSTEDDIACAKTFWQSVTLLPPMESRLVSSDIKQRLRTAPPGGHTTARKSTAGNSTYRVTPANNLAVQEFLTKARTMQQMEEFLRLREFASARDEDRELLYRRRKERMKKEEISRNRITRKKKNNEEITIINESDNEMEEDVDKIMKDLDQFDKSINKNLDVDSD